METQRRCCNCGGYEDGNLMFPEEYKNGHDMDCTCTGDYAAPWKRETCSEPGCNNHLEGGFFPTCRYCFIEGKARAGEVLIPTPDCARTGAWEYVKPYRVGRLVEVHNARIGYAGWHKARILQGMSPEAGSYYYRLRLEDGPQVIATHRQIRPL